MCGVLNKVKKNNNIWFTSNYTLQFDGNDDNDMFNCTLHIPVAHKTHRKIAKKNEKNNIICKKKKKTRKM